MAVFAPGSQEYMRLHADVFRSFHYHFDFSYNLEQNLGQLNMLVTSALRGLYKHIYFVAWVLKQLLPCQKDVQRLILQWIIGNNPGKRATDRLLKCTRQDWRSKSTNDGRIEFLEYEEG